MSAETTKKDEITKDEIIKFLFEDLRNLEKEASLKKEALEKFSKFKQLVEGFLRSKDDGQYAFDLGCYYRDNNEDAQRDYEKAFKLFQIGHIMNNYKATNALAFAYAMGLGVSQNMSRAIELWQYSVNEYKSAEAMTNLGLAYKQGKGVLQNMTKAVELFKKAVELDDTYAMNNLAICYKNGQGTEKNMDEAIKWFNKAIEQGSSDATFNLAAMYRDNATKGKDLEALTEKDLEELKTVYELFEKSAELGCEGGIECMAMIGHIYVLNGRREQGLEMQEQAFKLSDKEFGNTPWALVCMYRFDKQNAPFDARDTQTEEGTFVKFVLKQQESQKKGQGRGGK